jgi:hypothetical protein
MPEIVVKVCAGVALCAGVAVCVVLAFRSVLDALGLLPPKRLRRTRRKG